MEVGYPYVQPGRAGPVSAAKAEAKNVTYFTYIPATGGIFMYKGPDILFGKLDMPPVGLAPPMVPGTAGSGIRASGLIGFDTDNPVPVVDTLGKHAEQHQIDADAQVEIDRCQEIMLLPALMEFATYPSLHSAFSEVPLVQINSSHLLPDSLVQAGPVGGKGPVDKTIPELHVEFDAKGYRIHVPEPVGSLYRTLTSLDMARLRGLLEAREIKHEMEAFEALKGIGEEVWLNDIDEDREDRTLAAKLGEAIRTNRTKYGSRITHMAMGSRMYQRYLRSARIRGSPVPGSSTDTPGVGPLPGLEYVTVIISRLIDSEAEGTIYAVDRHAGALYGQGAIVLDTFENKNGRTAMITEYYQYMITDKHVDRASVDPPGRRTALRINVP